MTFVTMRRSVALYPILIKLISNQKNMCQKKKQTKKQKQQQPESYVLGQATDLSKKDGQTVTC